MKIKNIKTEKDFDTVKTFRAIKEKISLDMANMSFEEIKKYLKEKSSKIHEADDLIQTV